MQVDIGSDILRSQDVGLTLPIAVASLTGPGINRFAIETLTENTNFPTPLSVAIFLYDKVPKDRCCSSKLREGICTFRFSV
ncbi:hypothetical protein O8B93_14700 [Agrobacterium rhizogenes]|uniref:hypothetical protein n=1 Tax=Rhizobium rhizogenes TaxID=359 RepID=UPI0022B6BA4D|nr:hypothetical protein [Rhizobium rhizogenes]MCZ7448836.1 hypothetical protein [Rhizobium rhizogenes]